MITVQFSIKRKSTVLSKEKEQKKTHRTWAAVVCLSGPYATRTRHTHTRAHAHTPHVRHITTVGGGEVPTSYHSSVSVINCELMENDLTNDPGASSNASD